MNDKQRKMIFELFTGTIISQEIIIQALHQKGIVRKKDIIDRLDYFIEYFEKKGSDQIAVPMRYLKKNLGKEFPQDYRQKAPPAGGYPKWFQGVIHGGAPSAPKEEN